MGEVAKRFIDTEIFKKPWFADLSAEDQQLWFYICTQCDIAGFWEKNYPLASFELKRTINDRSFDCFGDRVFHLEDNKIWVKGFVEFQYGELSTACKPHKAVSTLLRKRGIDPNTLTLTKGLANPLDTDKTRQDKIRQDCISQEGGMGETKSEIPPLPECPIGKSEITLCENAFKSTLEAFGQDRPVLPHEQMTIARLVKRYGVKTAAYALFGMQFEPKTETFKPEQHVSLTRLERDPLQFEKAMNRGAAERAKEKKRQEAQRRKNAPPDAPPHQEISQSKSEARRISELVSSVTRNVHGGAA